jgi:hypothetical protein
MTELAMTPIEDYHRRLKRIAIVSVIASVGIFAAGMAVFYWLLSRMIP